MILNIGNILEVLNKYLNTYNFAESFVGLSILILQPIFVWYHFLVY